MKILVLILTLVLFSCSSSTLERKDSTQYDKGSLNQFGKSDFDRMADYEIRENIESLKIDTHEDNLGMQSLIKKLGYQYCGIIYTNYDAKRLAFEKIIDW